ncbi:hypothetical protein BGZ96_008538 [Linnemannia gamsii]|uniref:Uncharacterized protein n=1 Tax=Linnemannia gamsii TaxID=64522 RepID=A0ABQ7JZ12_9FUNG|nr:hypothetical protein BGZ96_008538 [Linnemannia gamsii]
MVNKNFCAIVSSLKVWSHMFVIAYGTKAHLRSPVGVPKSKSYMMFMCSSSLHVCERCFCLTGYNADSKYKLLLSIPILLPKRSTDGVKHLGERITTSVDETIVIETMRRHFGGDVGISAFKESTEAYDEKTETRIRWYQLQE